MARLLRFARSLVLKLTTAGRVEPRLVVPTVRSATTKVAAHQGCKLKPPARRITL
jgi:hypothetical protein